MKTLACADFGKNCDFVAKNETEEGVIKKMMEHAEKVHPDDAKEMKKMSKEEMMNMMREKIKEA